MKKLLWICFSLTLGFSQTWERIIPCYVNNVYYAGAYSGGVNYSRPDWVDIDNDGDYDLMIGAEHGGMHFYRNIGTASSPSWLFVTEFYENIDIENRCSQAFVDIDNDNDYDILIGEQDGNINFYRNVGSPTNDTFVLVTENYNGINVGSFSAPVCCDIDADGDYDLFIGEHYGNLNYYRNDGTASTPAWTFVTETWFSIDVGTKNIPWFADIDADGDYDLFIGDAEGMTTFYRNDGTAAVPNMVFVTDNYISDVGNTNAPTFVDIDNDADLDLFIGEYIGNVNFYRNTGTPQNASWSFVRKYYLEIDLNSSSTPALADIDADGDLDMICGEWVGILDYYQNNGTAADHRWTIVSENYGSFDAGDNSRPALVDIDDDNDYDMFVGNLIGQVYFYRNTGTASAPNYTLIDTMYNNIDVGDMCAPTFVDIDADNDFDLFLGNDLGVVWFYRNTGTAAVPAWTLVSNNYNGIDVGDRNCPTFTDVDRDGDYDLFIGEAGGSIWHYRNDGSASTPSFTLATASFAGIDVEENTAPVFGDMDADGDPDLLIGERWGGLNYYRQNVLDMVPPNPPYIYARKSGSNMYLWWRAVTTDTAGNPENITRYNVYRSTSPSFVPGTADSIGVATYPDTFFTNLSAVPSGQSYYYLVKAVDIGNNRSRCSNMGFKFNKFYNENASTSDRNWVSMPYRTVYSSASDATLDLSGAGNPLIKLTNLRNEQYYENWIWDPEFLEWYGSDFPIDSGRAYEMETIKDTVLYLVGWDNPKGIITLNENVAATDRNWVSIPYNAVYGSASSITTEYSPAGNPLIKLTNLRDEQYYENWIWDPDFLEWYGVDYTLVKGRSYEFETVRDTFWNPTQYNNNAKEAIIFTQRTIPYSVEVQCGDQLYPDRSPAWELFADASAAPSFSSEAMSDPARYQTMTAPATDDKISDRESGVSHVVRAHIRGTGLKKLTFTAYLMEHPRDALSNRMIGCGTANKKDLYSVWFDVGNFQHAWSSGEEVMMVIEAVKDGRGVMGTKLISLDDTVSLQEIGFIEMEPMPILIANKSSGSQTWRPMDNPHVIGYSIFLKERRLNTEIITHSECLAAVATDLKPVLIGGYETIYGSSVEQKPNNPLLPLAYALDIYPNPFTRTATIRYNLPAPKHLTIGIYDISGRLVKTLISGYVKPGYFQVPWSGRDDDDRQVANGIYFIRMETEDFEAQGKVLYLR